jgi:arylsulfatase A-like enzyme
MIADLAERGMDTFTSRMYWFYSALYCGFVLLIYIPGVNDYLHQFAGRQGVIVDALLSSPMLFLQIATYALTVLTLNLLPLVPLLISLRRSAPLRTRLGLSHFTQFLLAVVSLWMAILLFNKLHFPHSSFAVLIPFDDRFQLVWTGSAALALYVVTGVAPALGWFATRLAGLARNPVARIAAAGILAFSVIPPLYSAWTAPTARSEQPNIIIIGLDSVSPLHLQRHPGKLPILERLLAESAVFEQNITPLARTFPAWTSILTAKYPVHSGARFNLTAFDQVETQATVPNYLKAQGYVSVYAQDERQFNNIDETFGFDRVIGPAAGAADIVLAKAADHPLANLALLTPWADTLFPFIALNRAASVQYDPDEFVEAIIDGLPEARDKPLFLATHFCLAHLPYRWRDAIPPPQGEAPKSMEDRHIHALQRLEKQVDKLLRALQQSGRLDNAILVILSDHGEALGYDDALWPSQERYTNAYDEYMTKGYTAFPRSSGFTGHGMNTLDRTEHHSVLAFQGFGQIKARFQPGRRDRITSLVDVLPTLLGALKHPLPSDIDGVDLLANEPERNTRIVTAETGLRFGSLASIAKFDEATLLRESRNYYRVEPTSARLILKKETYPELVANKDLTVHTDDWMLALLRKPGSPHYSRVALLVHKPTGAWTLGKDTALIRRAPLATLTHGLQRLYGPELADFQKLWPFDRSAGG